MTARSFSISRDEPPAILIGKDAPEPVHFAGQELRKYLETILDTAMPAQSSHTITLCLDAGGKPGDEGFEISGSQAGLLIQGDGPAGVVYGVYEFLRRYGGCRFSGPGPEGEYVPNLEKIDVSGLPLRMTPRLWYRGLQCSAVRDRELMIRQIDWMAKNGMNFIVFRPLPDGVAAENGNRFGPGVGDVRMRCVANRYTNGWYRRNIVPEVLRRGLKLDMNNHNVLTWLPPETYFEQHPEWYRLADGKRTADSLQFCICSSNREAVSTLIANVRKYVRENPEVKIVGVIPEDGFGACQCDECRKLDYHPDDALRSLPSYKTPEGENRSLIRRYASLVNEVAREVRKEFPDVLVGYAAYVDIQWPPRDTELEDNVVPWVALYGARCYAHTLGPHGCESNRFYYDILEQWKRAHKGRTILYEYYMGRAGYMSLPFPVARQICRDWPGLKEIGIQGATVQSNPQNMSIYGLNYLAFARNGWQDSVDYSRLLEDYLLGMFGSVAPDIRPVYDALDKVVQGIEVGDAQDSLFLRETGIECLRPNARNIRFFLEEIGIDFIRGCVQRALDHAGNDRERRQVSDFGDAVTYWQQVAELYVIRDNALEAKQADRADEADALYRRCCAKAGELIEYAESLPQRGWIGATPEAMRRLGLGSSRTTARHTV